MSFRADSQSPCIPGRASLEGSELPYLHTEHDIEIASRSADSTEDSLGDSNLSPETVDKHAYHKSQRGKNESGDFLDSDSSDLTDSEDLSSEDMDDDLDFKSEKGFVPIQIPEVQVENVDLRKKSLKEKGVKRQCKSESDKSSLSVEEKAQAFSREGSLSRYRADGSWIKPLEDEDEKDEENSDKLTAGTVTDDVAKEGVDKEEGLWMNIESDADTGGKLEKHDVDEITVQTDTERSEKDIDNKSEDHYSRENIPWNPGTVLKQKQDIERYGSFSGSLGAAGRNTDPDETCELDLTQIKPEDCQEVIKTPEQPVITLESSNQSGSCDISDQSGKGMTETSQSEVSSEDLEGVAVLRESRKSVYEEEEIDLPEGIVRKTKMEIEERNR